MALQARAMSRLGGGPTAVSPGGPSGLCRQPRAPSPCPRPPEHSCRSTRGPGAVPGLDPKVAGAGAVISCPAGCRHSLTWPPFLCSKLAPGTPCFPSARAALTNTHVHVHPHAHKHARAAQAHAWHKHTQCKHTHAHAHAHTGSSGTRTHSPALPGSPGFTASQAPSPQAPLLALGQWVPAGGREGVQINSGLSFEVSSVSSGKPGAGGLSGLEGSPGIWSQGPQGLGQLF